MRHPAQQSGVALITVLLVTAVATVIASEVVNRLYFDIQRNAAQLQQAQAYQYALGGEALIRQLLHEDLADNRFDHEQDRWANLKPSYQFDQGLLNIKVIDLNSRLNLNNLVNATGDRNKVSYEQFKRLFAELGMNSQQLDTLADWLDEDSLPNGAGRDDSYYLALEAPYRTANQPITHLSELTLIDGWKLEHLERLAPYITALPEKTRINVNTAPAEVLATLSDKLDSQKVQRLVSSRQGQGFDSTENFISHDQLAGIKIDPSLIAVSSEYFLVYVESSFAESRVRLQSLLHRSSKGEITLVSRDRNSRFLWPKE